MMIRRNRKYGNLREYFIYFILLSLAVVIFTAGFSYFFSMRTLRETSIQNREVSLVLMRNTFENLISQIDNTINLSQNYLLQYRFFFESGTYTVLQQLRAELNTLNKNKYVQSVCVYYRDWQYTVSAEFGQASLDLYYDRDFLELLDNMGFRYQRTIFRIKELKNGESIPVLSIIRSIPVYYFTEHPVAWAVIDIDLTAINDSMKDIFNVENSFFSIIDVNYTPLISIGSSSLLDNTGIPERMSLMDLSQDLSQDIVRLTVDGKLVLIATSREHEWNLIYIEPNSGIIKNWFWQLLISMSGAITIAIIISYAGSIFFSRRIYNPIKEIFDKTYTSGNDQRKKETELIIQKIDELIENNNMLEEEKSLNAKTEPVKNQIQYPISIENEIFLAFREDNLDKFIETFHSFRNYYSARTDAMDIIHGAYFRLIYAFIVITAHGTGMEDENTDYRIIYTFTAIDDIHSWIMEKFLHVFNVLHTNKKPSSGLLKDVCEYIDSNLDGDITAKGLWQKFNYHPSTFHRLFRDELNLTLKNYVDAKRIEKSKELLFTTNLKIHEIAVQSGYTHTQSFIAFFSNAVGCTPAEYRARNIRK